MRSLKANRNKMTLKMMIPEVNNAQWVMLEQVLLHDLELTEDQQQMLSSLIGSKS